MRLRRAGELTQNAMSHISLGSSQQLHPIDICLMLFADSWLMLQNVAPRFYFKENKGSLEIAHSHTTFQSFYWNLKGCWSNLRPPRWVEWGALMLRNPWVLGQRNTDVPKNGCAIEKVFWTSVVPWTLCRETHTHIRKNHFKRYHQIDAFSNTYSESSLINDKNIIAICQNMISGPSGSWRWQC